MRYFHGGANAVDPDREAALGVDDKDIDLRRKNAVENHKLTRPHGSNLTAELVDGEKKVFIRVPEAFWRYNRFPLGNGQVGVHLIPESTRTEWQQGSIALALPGVGFWVVPPGGYIDIDVQPATVKSVAPHLLTEAEAIERGIAQPAASPVKQSPKLK